VERKNMAVLSSYIGGACMSIEDPVCGMWRLHELIEDGTGHNLGADMGMGGGLRMSMFRFARAARSR